MFKMSTARTASLDAGFGKSGHLGQLSGLSGGLGGGLGSVAAWRNNVVNPTDPTGTIQTLYNLVTVTLWWVQSN